MGGQHRRAGWGRKPPVLKDIEGFVAESAPAKRRCGLCPTVLRGGNKSEPPRCGVCAHKYPGRSKDY
jgi:hypothetical protein